MNLSASMFAGPGTPDRRYADLLLGFCDVAGVPGTAEFLQTGQLVVDGVSLTLARDIVSSGELLVIYADYGPVPEAFRREIYGTLLTANLYLFGGLRSGAFAVNPASDHVLMTTEVDINATTPAGLLEALRTIAKEATVWRDVLVNHPEKLAAIDATSLLQGAVR